MYRPRDLVYRAFIVAACWYGMMAVHELGHVLGAWGTGGSVERVLLHPLAISRTDLAFHPRPLFVAWAGPIGGILLPVLAWGAARATHFRHTPLLQFFAGFCLIANGAYLAGGSFAEIGDCGDLLRHGAAIWQLWLFGGVTAATGLYTWHRLGLRRGVAPTPRAP